jgi:hypothetical protein
MLVLTRRQPEFCIGITRRTFLRGDALRDYSHIGGHVTRTAATVTTTPTDSPVVIGSAEDGGGSGDGGGGSGEEGGDGDGDGEPPTPAGPAAGGDGQHPILLLLLLILLCACLLRDILTAPLKAFHWLYRYVPSIGCVWVCGQYLFPYSVRHSVYRPELRSLLRDRRLARRRALPFRLWVGFCLRLRTGVLLLRCVRETLKEVGVEKGAIPGL